MPLKVDVKFERVKICNSGEFFGKVLFVNNDNLVQEASETSLKRYEDGWRLPPTATFHRGDNEKDSNGQMKWQMIAPNDDAVIQMEFILYRLGPRNTPGSSDEVENEFYKVASTSKIIHPQKAIFNTHNTTQDFKDKGLSVSERIHLFSEKCVGDLRVYRGSVILHYNLRWEQKLDKPINPQEQQPMALIHSQRENNGKHHTAKHVMTSDLDEYQNNEEKPVIISESPAPIDFQEQMAQKSPSDKNQEFQEASTHVPNGIEDIDNRQFQKLHSVDLTANPTVIAAVESQRKDTNVAHDQTSTRTEEFKTKDFGNLNFEPEDHFPSMDAVKEILPQYHALVKSPPKSADSVVAHVAIQEPSFNEKGKMFQVSREGLDLSVTKRQDSVQALLHRTKSAGLTSRPGTTLITQDLDSPIGISEEARKSLDAHVVAVLDYQTKELDRYRVAVRRLGEDVVHLRKDVARLEATNSQLRTKMYYADEIVDLSKLDLQNGSRSPENTQLKKKLLAEAERNADITERLETVQNDLIKAKEREKSFLKTQQAHQAQQALVQQLQTKLAKYNLLEKTCKDQEKVIEALEKRIFKLGGGGVTSTYNEGGEASGIKGHRNTQLREADIKGGLTNGSYGNSRDGDMVLHQSAELHERFRLLQNLERAEGRIMALEQQLLENVRQWGKEKTALQLAGMNGSLEPYHTTLVKPLTPPLPAIEPSYRIVERQPRYYASHVQPFHPSYRYGTL